MSHLHDDPPKALPATLCVALRAGDAFRRTSNIKKSIEELKNI